MRIPTLFDVVELHLMSDWRKEIEENENCNIMGDPQEVKKKLAEELGSEQKKLLNSFELAMINRYDCIYYFLCKQLFHFAVNAGMDFQKVIDEAD